MIEQCLKGCKILFLTWPFYQYPKAIKDMMVNMGADVRMYLSAPSNDFLKVRVLERLEGLKRRYFNRIIDEISDIEFDYILVINAAIFPEYFLRKLMSKHNKAIKILYSWDSIAVYPKALMLHKYFDRVYSFDYEDVKKYGYMIFLPLFFCDDLYDEATKVKIKYDLSFVGFGHTERYRFIKAIEKIADKEQWNTFFKLYLPSKIHYIRGKYIKKLFPDAKKNDFIYKPLPLEVIKEITSQTRIIIDMELSNQSGLTMRTIETHGMRKKLITTNPNIKEYDFYNENNILVVDRNNPVVNSDFVSNEYEILPDELYNKYSLSNWIKVIFQVNK